MARKLEETKIACLPADKDLYTYYLLKTLPGRSIIFLNSISSARRLTKLLSYFGLPVYPLHGQMQQRQRLKNLDRFKATETGLSPFLHLAFSFLLIVCLASATRSQAFCRLH